MTIYKLLNIYVIAVSQNSFSCWRIFLALLLILLIGGKVAMPAFAGSKQEKILSAEQGDDDSEKKAENDPSLKKEKEAVGFYNEHIAFLPQQIDILHNTAYQNNYKSSYYRKITIPPPDSI